MGATIIDGKKLAADVEKEVAKDVAKWIQEGGPQPHLTVIQVGVDPRSSLYIKRKRAACERVGIKSELIHLCREGHIPFDIQNKVLDVIRHQTYHAHGILVQLPLPNSVWPHSVFEAIPPNKDVDVFNPVNLGLLVQGNPKFKPCTPHAVQQILKRSGISVAGEKVVVINRSNIVGKPLAAMLVQDDGDYANATVTVCHDRTPGPLLRTITRNANIVIVAVGIPGFLTADMISPGAVVIDVGITQVKDKVVGDVAFDEVKEVAGAITPVPGGVGPVTVSMLLMNTLHAAYYATRR